jgi:hypothetical protein
MCVLERCGVPPVGGWGINIYIPTFVPPKKSEPKPHYPLSCLLTFSRTNPFHNPASNTCRSITRCRGREFFLDMRTS